MESNSIYKWFPFNLDFFPEVVMLTKLSSKTMAFDVTQANDPKRTGIGRVVEEQLNSICWLFQQNRWPFGNLTLLSAWPFRLPEVLIANLQRFGVKLIVLPCASMYVYRLTKVSWWVWKNKPDLLYIPEPIYPGLQFASNLVIMHYDLIARQSPKTVSRHIRFLYRVFLISTLRRANRVGVDSEFVRNQTAALLHEFKRKSEVVPIYLHTPQMSREKRPEILESVVPYALFIGNLLPHKNIRRLLKAFAACKSKCPDEFIPLYIVGRSRPEVDDLQPLLDDLEAKGIIKHFGYLTDEELNWLKHHAKYLAFPSLIEGYGLPIMESMSIGLPVLTSRGVATEETADGAAHLVDPHNTKSILKGIIRLNNDASYRQELAAKGLAHAEQFTREKHATALAEFLKRGLT